MRSMIVAILLCLAVPVAIVAQDSEEKDRRQIVDHVHSIFQAFVNQDLTRIRETHSEDWMGFQNPSRAIIRGIDEYMRGPEQSTVNVPMQRYEIRDIEVKLYGDIAVVYYIAEWDFWVKRIGRSFTARARSVDIYRKDPGGWIQVGSHLSILPAEERDPSCQSCFDVRPTNTDD